MTPKGFERTSSIVRSVSEYKTNLCGQKPTISKSQTSDAFDVSPSMCLPNYCSLPVYFLASESSAKMLEEVDEIKFAENENCSLSAVFFTADQAPLVNLSDICSGFSLEAATETTSKPAPTPCPDNSMYLSSTSSTSDAPPFILTRGQSISLSLSTNPVPASTTDETASSCSQQTVIPIQIPVPSPIAQTQTLTTNRTENRRTDHQRSEYFGILLFV